MWAGFARFARNRMALFGAAVLLCLLLLVVFTPVIYPDDPFKLVGPALQPPGGRFLLGTDTLGRDVAAEIAYGAHRDRADAHHGILPNHPGLHLRSVDRRYPLTLGL